MHLNNYIDIMFKSTPTAYIEYQIIKNSDNKIIDYVVIKYNSLFLEIINANNIIDQGEIKNFLQNIKIDMPQIKQSIDEREHTRIVAYSNLYKKWLNLYLFYPSEDTFIIQIVDLTKEKQSEQKFRRKSQELQRVMDVINDLILVFSLDRKIYLVNKICEKTLGYKKDELIGQDLLNILGSKNYNKIISSYKDDSLSENNNIVRTQINTKDNTIVTIEWNCSTYGGYIFLVGRNITTLLEKEEKIRYLSYHDKLTGVYNRSFFEQELKRLDNDRHLPLSIIMGDVDGLKITNDVFGHLKGDELLKSISQALKTSIRKGDILSRWGGDEFIILLPNTSEETVEEITGRICENLKNIELALGCASISLGVASKISADQDIYDVLATAEDIMYADKARAGKTFRKNIINLLIDFLYNEEYEISSAVYEMKLYLRKLSKVLKLSINEIKRLLLLADLHDIGLISVPKDIMNKSETLDKNDWEEIKKHVEIGYRIALAIPEISHLADNILYHHERYDGKGYPHGLVGKEIPYLNRIFLIVDVYVSLKQDKIYRKSYSKEESIEYMKANKSILFDPFILDVFLDMLDE